MGVRRFEELVAWQLCVELHAKVVEVTTRSPARRDRKFCDQIRESSRNCAPHIAEGFVRFVPREFKHFLRYALSSLAETQTHLVCGRNEGLVTASDYEALATLARRAVAATSRLRSSIRGPQDAD